MATQSTAPKPTLPLIDRAAGSAFGISSKGSPFFTLAINTKTVTDSHDDPGAAVIGDHASYANILRRPIPDCYSVLDLYHIYTGGNPVTALKVKAYGLVPHQKPASSLNSLMPWDGLIAWTSPLSDGSLGLWVPLPLVLDQVTTEQTFSNTPEVVANDAANAVAFSMSPKKTVYTLGCQQVMVLISQAADTLTLGAVIGRLGN